MREGEADLWVAMAMSRVGGVRSKWRSERFVLGVACAAMSGMSAMPSPCSTRARVVARCVVRQTMLGAMLLEAQKPVIWCARQCASESAMVGSERRSGTVARGRLARGWSAETLRRSGSVATVRSLTAGSSMGGLRMAASMVWSSRCAMRLSVVSSMAVSWARGKLLASMGRSLWKR